VFCQHHSKIKDLQGVVEGENHDGLFMAAVTWLAQRIRNRMSSWAFEWFGRVSIYNINFQVLPFIVVCWNFESLQ